MLEIEPMEAIVSDRELILVASFCGREIADKLLYEGDQHYRITRDPTFNGTGRVNMVHNHSDHPGISETA